MLQISSVFSTFIPRIMAFLWRWWYVDKIKRHIGFFSFVLNNGDFKIFEKKIFCLSLRYDFNASDLDPETAIKHMCVLCMWYGYLFFALLSWFYYQIKGESFVELCDSAPLNTVTPHRQPESIKHYWIIEIDSMIRVAGKLNPQCLLLLKSMGFTYDWISFTYC